MVALALEPGAVPATHVTPSASDMLKVWLWIVLLSAPLMSYSYSIESFDVTRSFESF